MAAILILHGPNLNLLGSREPEIYGAETLDEINHRLQSEADRAGATLACLQSNGEQELVEAIHQAQEDGTQFIIINPAAFTHTSVAILDALVLTELPVVEIHISNIFRRESFRQHSYVSAGATGIISGFGARGYRLAIDAMVGLTASKKDA